MSPWRPSYRPAALVAFVRVTGAGLTILGLVTGIRLLGAHEFGVSVVLLALGQLAALPVSALERLVLRLAATHEYDQAGAVLRLGDRYAGAVIVLGIVISWPLHTAGIEWLDIIAVISTAATVGAVTNRQAFHRATGRLMWGQVPNEIVRPCAVLLAYVIAWRFLPEHAWGAGATALSAVMAWVTISVMPSPWRETKSASALERTAPLRGAIGSLLGISILAAVVERGYPILTGALESPTSSSALAVGMRLIQLGLFGQAFAIYYFAPRVAGATVDREVAPSGVRALRNIRALSLSCAAPIITCCLLVPDTVEEIFGGSLDLDGIWIFVVMAIAIQVATGPAQALLLMSGRERPVAVTYLIGTVTGLSVFALGGYWGAVGALGSITLTYAIWATGQLCSVKRSFGAFH